MGDALLWQSLPLQCAMFGVPAPSTPLPAPDVFLKDEAALEVGHHRYAYSSVVDHPLSVN